MPSFASKFALAVGLAASSLAAPTLSAAAQSTQTPAERNFNQGETYFKANNWAAAIPYYKAAVAADPSFAAAYYSLGLAYYQNKDPKDAAAAFKMYLKYKPNDAPGLLLLGISLHAAGDNAAAVDALHRVIDLKPEAKYLNSAYYNMGVAYEDAHQLPEAMQTYIVLRTISPKDAQDLLNYMRSVDPDLKAADAAPPTPSTTPPSPAAAPPTTSKPTAPVSAAKPAAPSQPIPASPSSSKTSALPDLPDLPAARTAIQAANLLGADDLTLTDVIFILQYRDASVTNQNAAKKVWSEVLAKEKDGEPLRISNALVISSTKTTVELALSDDCKHSKTADTHLVLAKPLSAPARAGMVTDISGEITSYKTNPIMLNIEHGQLLKAAAASTTPSPAASTHTAQPKPAPAAAPATAAPAPPSPADNWILYTNPNGNFASRMPGAPKDTINPTASDQVSHTLQASADGNAYTVVYVYNQSEQTVDAATYTVFRDNFMKGMPTCQMITEGDPSPVVRGYVGHSYRLNCVFSGTKVTIIGDLYWGRHFAYAVMAVFPTATFDPQFARTFVDSFSLVDPSK